MRNTSFIIAILGVGTLLSSCKKDQYYLYNDVARIQFGPEPTRIYTSSYEMADTMKPYTFYYEPVTTTKDTVYFDIYAIGGVSDKDRSFALEQEILPGAVNAVAGTHYVPFNDPSLKDLYVIKAGQVHASVPVVLLRDPSLKEDHYKLCVRIAQNENFRPGEVRKLWRRVEFTDKLSRPAAWDASGERYYWGKYSTVKHAFMIQASGEKWDQEFMAGVMLEYAMVSFWRLEMKTALVNYNNAHPDDPLTDENGETVIFP